MRSKEVLNLLRVTRPTLTKYVKSGKIKVIRKPNGHYEYDEESVYAFLNKDVRRKTYIYARVSTSKQKKDLEKFNCEIVVMSEIGSTKLDSQEIFEEIISLLHCYSMKLYSKRKEKRIREVLMEDAEEETGSGKG